MQAMAMPEIDQSKDRMPSLPDLPDHDEDIPL
jgi:hypothetical protein